MKSRFTHLLLVIPIIISLSCHSKADKEKSVAAMEQIEKTERPQNIILMIGDGMGLTQVTAGMIANNNQLHLERFAYVGLTKTSSSDALITDSAAGATALSTGKKTYNGAIGVAADTTSLETILEIAAKSNYATGLVATSSITHATPASFFAHQPYRYLDEEIAMDMLAAPVDFFIGGGKDFFELRKDSLNLLDSLEAKGFEIYDSIAAIPNDAPAKVACFIAKKQPLGVLKGRKDILPQATNKALEFLAGDEGFFLMIEGSQIDWAGHDNDSEGIVAEMLDFNTAIGEVLKFAEEKGNTLVIVTADHETGGYAIIGGEKETGTVEGAFNTSHHTAAMIPVFAYGPGAESFSGIYENTAIFDKMLELLKK